jgi:hypothetical protein
MATGKPGRLGVSDKTVSQETCHYRVARPLDGVSRGAVVRCGDARDCVGTVAWDNRYGANRLIDIQGIPKPLYPRIRDIRRPIHSLRIVEEGRDFTRAPLINNQSLRRTETGNE